MTDCKKLSPNAAKIFDQIGEFFPPDPWHNPQWIKVGRVFDNGWYDLRKAKDRKRLMSKKKSILGYMVELNALAHRQLYGSLTGFTRKKFSKAMQLEADQLLLLNDLDYQIETGDLVDA